ncbi:MAG TPA: hypothetical protein PKW35_03640 [Nannocystaceae bacterium]|nr:hypothetical protein [Nannocystaceae bacterium]
MAPANRPKRPISRLLSALGVGAIALATGCGSPCERLRAYVCDGRGEEYCKQVDGFLDTTLVGEGGAKLAGEPREEACRVVLGNVELQNAYRHKAKEKLLGEPYWEVAKNRKPAADGKTDAKAEPDDAKADAPK